MIIMSMYAAFRLTEAPLLPTIVGTMIPVEKVLVVAGYVPPGCVGPGMVVL